MLKVNALFCVVNTVPFVSCWLFLYTMYINMISNSVFHIYDKS